MKTRGTYILIALFFAGLLSLWWADQAKIPTRRQRERMSTRLLPELIDARPDDLQKIEILGGPTPLIFVRSGDGKSWQMTSPLNVEADPSKVETLAFNLKELSRKPEAETFDGDPAQFGLAPPERVVRLWGRKTSEPIASLDIGLESEKLARRYVRVTGSGGIEVIDAKGLALLKLPVESWRDRELFRVPSFEVDSVSLKSGASELKLRRNRDAWRLEAPFKTLAAEARVEGLIADLGSIRVLGDSQFVADDLKTADLARYGLNPPRLTIEVGAGRSSQQRPPQILHVGKAVEGKDDLVYVRRETQDDVMAVDSRILKDLKVEPNRYRSPKVADIKPARVTRIAVEQPSGKFELVRVGNEWTIVVPTSQRTERKAVEEFIKGLDKLETSTFQSPEMVADAGLDKSPMILKIWQAADPREGPVVALKPSAADPLGEPALTLKIGRRDAARRTIYAQLEGDTTVLALPESVGEVLPKSVLAFRDHQVLSEEIDAIKRITLSGARRKFVLNAPPLKFDSFRNTPMGWWMVEPIDAPADSASVGALLRVLSGLRAESLVAESASSLEPYGLKVPALSLTWSRLPRFSMVSETPVTASPTGVIALEDRSLLVGSPVPGRPSARFAKLSDRPMIFTLGSDVLTVLDAEWRDHQVFSFSPERVRKLRFDWTTQGLTIEASGDPKKPSWSFQGTVDAPRFDWKEVNSLVKSASNLTTNRYAQHFGEIPSLSGLDQPRLTIRFDLDDGTLPRTLRVGATDNRGQVFATTDPGKSGSIFLIPETLVKIWLKPPFAEVELPENVFGP